jgi:hypothetical protein
LFAVKARLRAFNAISTNWASHRRRHIDAHQFAHRHGSKEGREFITIDARSSWYWFATGGAPLIGVVNPGQTVSVGYSLVFAVPEPETSALMLGGLGVLGFVARRRSAAARNRCWSPRPVAAGKVSAPAASVCGSVPAHR